MTRLMEAWERAFRFRGKKLVEQGDNVKYRYDPEADALAITLLPGATSARTIEADERRFVDVDAKGRVIAIEVLWASAGFNLHDLVEPFGLSDYEGDLKEIQNTPFTPTG